MADLADGKAALAFTSNKEYHRELTASAALEKEAKHAKAMRNSSQLQQGDLVMLRPGLEHTSIGVSCRRTENQTASYACLGPAALGRIGMVARSESDLSSSVLQVVSLQSGILCEHAQGDLRFVDGSRLDEEAGGDAVPGAVVQPSPMFRPGDFVRCVCCMRACVRTSMCQCIALSYRCTATIEDVTTGLPWTNMGDYKKTVVCLRASAAQHKKISGWQSWRGQVQDRHCLLRGRRQGRALLPRASRGAGGTASSCDMRL